MSLLKKIETDILFTSERTLLYNKGKILALQLCWDMGIIDTVNKSDGKIYINYIEKKVEMFPLLILMRLDIAYADGFRDTLFEECVIKLGLTFKNLKPSTWEVRKKYIMYTVEGI